MLSATLWRGPFPLRRSRILSSFTPTENHDALSPSVLPAAAPASPPTTRPVPSLNPCNQKAPKTSAEHAHSAQAPGAFAISLPRKDPFMRIQGGTLRASNLAERRVLLTLGVDHHNFRVSRRLNPFAVAGHVKRLASAAATICLGSRPCWRRRPRPRHPYSPTRPPSPVLTVPLAPRVVQVPAERRRGGAWFQDILKDIGYAV